MLLIPDESSQPTPGVGGTDKLIRHKVNSKIELCLVIMKVFMRSE